MRGEVERSERKAKGAGRTFDKIGGVGDDATDHPTG
jgi:hypothetical protein